MVPAWGQAGSGGAKRPIMGMLLRFSPKATTYVPGIGNRTESAQIILFTGVRYDRDGSAKPSQKIKKRRKG